MAIVKRIECANGGTVMIADDCFRGITPEERERRRREVERAIWMIGQAVARRSGENPSDPASRATSP